MTKTDWRSEYRRLVDKDRLPVGEYGLLVCYKYPESPWELDEDKVENFIEQTRIEAQIEVLEDLFVHGLVVSTRNHKLMVRIENKLKTIKQK